MLGIAVDRPERTIVLSISTIDLNIRHDNDLLILIEILYLCAVPTPVRVEYGAVHGVPAEEGGVCIITHKYDVVRDAAPEIVGFRRVSPAQVVFSSCCQTWCCLWRSIRAVLHHRLLHFAYNQVRHAVPLVHVSCIIEYFIDHLS